MFNNKLTKELYKTIKIEEIQEENDEPKIQTKAMVSAINTSETVNSNSNEQLILEIQEEGVRINEKLNKAVESEKSSLNRISSADNKYEMIFLKYQNSVEQSWIGMADTITTTTETFIIYNSEQNNIIKQGEFYFCREGPAWDDLYYHAGTNRKIDDLDGSFDEEQKAFVFYDKKTKELYKTIKIEE